MINGFPVREVFPQMKAVINIRPQSTIRFGMGSGISIDQVTPEKAHLDKRRLAWGQIRDTTLKDIVPFNRMFGIPESLDQSDTQLSPHSGNQTHGGRGPLEEMVLINADHTQDTEESAHIESLIAQEE